LETTESNVSTANERHQHRRASPEFPALSTATGIDSGRPEIAQVAAQVGQTEDASQDENHSPTVREKENEDCMSKFRKKPVVIEAVQFTGQEDGFLRFQTDNESRDFLVMLDSTRKSAIFIQTLEGTHRADPGDWIIRGVKGEFYPCKPDIFEATYEPAL
jgi:hypothetical protein